MYRNRARDNDDEGGRKASKSGWKQAILAFLRDRPEAGARFRDIVEHCVGLIRGGTLVTTIQAENRVRVEQNVAQTLNSMKRAGLVIQPPGRVYFATTRGLAWMERHAGRVTEFRPPDEPA
jgi:hypothetical protein